MREAVAHQLVPAEAVLVENLDPELGPTLQAARRVVHVDGMAEVGGVPDGRIVDLALPLLEAAEHLPGAAGVDPPLAEQGGVGEAGARCDLSYDVQLGHVPAAMPGELPIALLLALLFLPLFLLPFFLLFLRLFSLVIYFLFLLLFLRFLLLLFLLLFLLLLVIMLLLPCSFLLQFLFYRLKASHDSDHRLFGSMPPAIHQCPVVPVVTYYLPSYAVLSFLVAPRKFAPPLPEGAPALSTALLTLRLT